MDLQSYNESQFSSKVFLFLPPVHDLYKFRLELDDFVHYNTWHKGPIVLFNGQLLPYLAK